MIKLFLAYLEEQNIPYRITNGYENIADDITTDNDHDILFQKRVFKNIEKILLSFSKANGFRLVQEYHQGQFAKNFFLYDPETKQVLNLDLYGELSRLDVVILNEKEVFEKEPFKYDSISILRPEQEFIQYLIKKIDKEIVSKSSFEKINSLFLLKKVECKAYLKMFFQNSQTELIDIFETSNYSLLQNRLRYFKKDFKNNPKTGKESLVPKLLRLMKRIVLPTGFTIAFLGPDGSGKSTIIEGLKNRQLPFRRVDYFHLKPIVKKGGSEDSGVVSNPHASNPYAALKSYGKLVYFIYQYNSGWLKNIFLLKRKSSLIIFDRYYDDLLVDSKRYRYGGSKFVANIVKFFIPRPALYFVLTADVDIIYGRKQEVSKEELNRQLNEYSYLVDGKRYLGIDVSKTPNEIIDEIYNVLMLRMNERY